MKRPGMVVLIGLLLGACSVTTEHDPAGPVPLQRGVASAFTPLVPASSTTPSCVDASAAPMAAGARAVALLYPRPEQRQVTVTVDRSGAPVKYLDVRGDLSERDGDVADRTTIGLYLTQGYAVLSNREGTGSPEIVEVPLEEVLTSSALGNPTEEMRRVLSACAAAL